MKTSPINGFIIEFNPLTPDMDPNTPIEGTVVGYEGWDNVLEIPSEVEIDKAIDTLSKDSKSKDVDCKVKIVVTGIDIGAFENYVYAEKVIIPNTITSIGKYAFKKCIKLNYVLIPGSVEEIPDYCFIDCKELKTVDLNDGLKKIGDYSFSNCKNLETFALPSSCNSLGFSCFEKCESLKSFEFPKEFKLRNVDYLAFKDSGFEKKFAKMLENRQLR